MDQQQRGERGRSSARFPRVLTRRRSAAPATQPVWRWSKCTKFPELVWSFSPPPRKAPRSYADLDSLTDESKQLAKELKRRDFAFVGPTTVYATMQAVGLVNDHLAGCFVREEVDVAQRDVQRLFPSR